MPDDTLQIAFEAIDKGLTKKIGEISGDLDKLEGKIDSSADAFGGWGDVLDKSFAGVGTNAADVTKKLNELGAATTDAAKIQNELERAQNDVITSAQKLAEAQQALTRNTDPSKHAELQREVSSAQVSLDHAAASVQKYSGELNKLSGSTDKAKGGFSGWQAAIVTANQGIDLLGRGIGIVKDVIDQTVGSTVKYAKEVRDLSTNLNLSAEETSKIIQASDDYGISVETITSALQMAVKKGFTPSIETLAKLADEYNNISDPTQRAARLTEVFGRNWTALTPMLKEGGTAIRNAAKEAERLGLVLSDKDVQAARELEIQIDNLNDRVDALKLKIGKQLIPDLTTSATNLTTLIGVLDGSATSAEKTQYQIDVLNRVFGEGAPIIANTIKQLRDYQKGLDSTAQTESERMLRANMAQVKSFGAVQTSISDLNRGVRNQADVYNVLDTAMDGNLARQKAMASAQAIVSQEMSDLNTVMSGAIKNEMKQFGDRQDDLATKAAKVKEELDKLQASQGAVATSTKKHGLTANETTLTQLQLAKAEAELAAQNTKTTMSAGELANAQQRLAIAKEKLDAINEKESHSARELTEAQANLANAQKDLANQTDPMKQAEMAVQVDKLKEKLGEASGAAVSYVDNSKRIKELQGEYDEINKEIAANAAAHEDATRRILFGYAEQQLAVGGLTETEFKALDALAVQWGLKSKEDIAAMQAIRDAAAGLAKDGSIQEFVNEVTGMKPIDIPMEPKIDIGALKANPLPTIDLPVAPKVDREAFREKKLDPIEIPVRPKVDAKAAKDLTGDLKYAPPLITPRVDTKQATIDITALVTNVGNTVPKEKSILFIANTTTATRDTNTFMKLFGSIPPKKEILMEVDGKAGLQVLDDIYLAEEKLYNKLVEITVKYKQEGEPPEGFQHGGSYIVPPNPRGGAGDYFPVLAAPGERVTVQTRAQQNTTPAAVQGGDTFIYNTTVESTLAMAMYMDKQRRDRLARSNARMGVI